MPARRKRRENRRLTTEEAADYLGYTANTLRTWRHRGEGPAYEQPKGPRGKALYWTADLDAWKARNREARS